MKINILGYTFHLEILILIVIIYLIMVIHIIYSTIRVKNIDEFIKEGFGVIKEGFEVIKEGYENYERRKTLKNIKEDKLKIINIKYV